MLLRIRGPDGMVRLTVEPTTTFGEMGEQVFSLFTFPSSFKILTPQLLPHLPKTVDPKTISMSNSPSGGDSKRLGDIVNFKIGQIGLKYVNLCDLTRPTH